MSILPEKSPMPGPAALGQTGRPPPSYRKMKRIPACMAVHRLLLPRTGPERREVEPF